MAPEVRMKRPIRYQPKPRALPNVTYRTTARTRPQPSRRKTLKRPSPVLSNSNMKSANRLYNPQHPSHEKLDSTKLFLKMEELQEMLSKLMKKRERLSMNHSAKAYLNAASYEDELLEGPLKLKGVKGTAFG